MSENLIKHQIISKEQIFSIINEQTEIINFLLTQDKKFEREYKINSKDKKIFKFLLFYLINSTKFYDIKTILSFKKISKQKYNQKINLISFKFFLICIFNSSIFCKFFGYKNGTISKKILNLIKALYLNHLIDKENLLNIIRLKLYLCFYEEKYISKISELDKEIINNKKIENMSPLEEIINFLISFIGEEMSKETIKDFNNIINTLSELMKNLFLSNYNNIFLLSNSLLFYRMIELSEISPESINIIIPLLKKVYKYSFNFDFYLKDLRKQFSLRKEGNIERKNNNIISKNKFLEELFGCEREKNIIKNGFVFNDDPNNGLVFYVNESFSFPKESFSIVISFKFMGSPENGNENSKNKKYCIFSIYESDKFQNTKFSIFIENNILKIFYNNKIQEIFQEKIICNYSYVLWIFSEETMKNNKTIFYLNNQKVEKNLNYVFPSRISTINLGFRDYFQQNNFEGIIGTFILFNKCFIKNSNNPNDIKVSRFFEKIFLKLNFNYEDIIYINSHSDYSFLSIETQEILNELKSEKFFSIYHSNNIK